jgi:formamidopyrimidine-DNA glycosylase
VPELPEVETVVRELQSLCGENIQSMDVHWARTVDGDLKNIKKAILSSEIKRVHRRGKYILIDFSDGSCCSIHLRMTGKLVFEPSEKDLKHLRVQLEFQSGLRLSYIDIRKFGRWHWWPASEPLLPKLGVEPLESTSVFMALKDLKTRREIKKVLLDQNILAGVGNIYADEALFASRIHPNEKGCDLSLAQCEKLSLEIPRILHASIANMGTTLSDYRTTKNIGGENQHVLKVYGQTGRPCSVCETVIVRTIVGARSTHHCPACQSL